MCTTYSKIKIGNPGPYACNPVQNAHQAQGQVQSTIL